MLKGLKSTRARIHVAYMCNTSCVVSPNVAPMNAPHFASDFFLRAKKTASAEERAAISESSVSGHVKTVTRPVKAKPKNG